ncbi:hypothetical protein B0A48_11291 [Cryoendolithus antarcticus]|uniref:Disease resistance R13L4/SHOC-2-like LRR domain-containing protein n=1 Tax=Cryoendolithus antarcticus TaxID=1507870 RepID=A0A1V8SUZ2_9PEZI|nr:hypothetical protein B0A48_11291 [Cryoendolithus antarcticus]
MTAHATAQNAMASDTGGSSDGRPFMAAADIIAFVKKELDIDDEHLARVVTTSSGDFPRDAHSGVTLDLSHKNIRDLPVEVVGLIRDKVERLALSHNPTINVPTQIVHCDRLRYLNLRWNGLRNFPEAILQLSKLEILDISKNRIVAIPEGIKRMTSLKFLAVARNKITRLPLSLGEMTSLSKLKFDENPIEFPPPEVFAQSMDGSTVSLETEKEKDVCQQVKRFLKQAALRERMMNGGESDTSESNVETPRPVKRGFGGRFPVRPSISGIDALPDFNTGPSPPNNVPPIPSRSHARITSQTLGSLGLQSRRPGIAPLLTSGGDFSRSRSETVSSTASLRARRQGFVPSKRNVSNTLDLSAVNEMSGQASARSSTATVRPPTSRKASMSSLYRSVSTATSAASSRANSPVDDRFDRGPTPKPLPAAKSQGLSPVTGLQATKRLSYILHELHRSIGHVARGLKASTPKKTMLERQLFTAGDHHDGLDQHIGRVTEDSQPAALKGLVSVACSTLKAYEMVVRELKGSVQKIVTSVEPLFIRCLLHQVYMTMLEARNICKVLGFMVVIRPPEKRLRASQAWSTKTVTPTQPRPITSRRLRGNTILRSTSSNATLRTMPPPVPLNSSASSRTNTMTSLSASSLSATTPRSGGSFNTSLPSRSNTLRSVAAAEDSDEGDLAFERIFFKLRSACELALSDLPLCLAEFKKQRENAETSAGRGQVAAAWTIALDKCKTVIRANDALHNRLMTLRLKDPGVRKQRDFWLLCDAFVSTWTDLASEVKILAQNRIDITAVRRVMRPLQRCLKEASKIISSSPLYQQHMRLHASSNPLPPSLSITTTSSHAIPPGPLTAGGGTYATPLAAALGTAAQASLVPSASTVQMQNDYSFQGGPALLGGGIRDMHNILRMPYQMTNTPGALPPHITQLPQATQSATDLRFTDVRGTLGMAQHDRGDTILGPAFPGTRGEGGGSASAGGLRRDAGGNSNLR